MSSFNMEMDRYLEKRSFSGKSHGMSASPSKKDKKKNTRFSKIRDAVKIIFDVDEVINLNNIKDTHRVSYFEKKSFKSKLMDYFKTQKEKNGTSIEIENTSSDDSDATISKSEISPSKSKMENDKFVSSRSFITDKKNVNPVSAKDTIPLDEVNRVLKNSSFDNVENKADDLELQKLSQKSESLDPNSVSGFDEFRDDLRDVIKITYRIMKSVPPEAIKEFRNSKDFKDYVEILNKYKLLKKKPENI